MKKLILTSIVLIICTTNHHLHAITLYSQSSGTWGIATVGLFNTIPGGGGISYDGDATEVVNDMTTDIVIQSGHTINFSGGISIHNLTIESTAFLRYLLPYNANFTDKLVLNGGELIVDGEIGNGIPLIPGDQDHILVIFSGSTNSISGAGKITLEGLVINSAAGLTISTNVNLFHFDDNGLYKKTLWWLPSSSTNGDLIIDATDTLNIYGDFSLDYDAYDDNWTDLFSHPLSMQINGVVDIHEGHLLLRTDNSTSNVYNITIHSSGKLITKQSIRAGGHADDPSPVPGDSRVTLILQGQWETMAEIPITYLESNRSSVLANPFSRVIFAGDNLQQVENNIDPYGFIELAGTGAKKLMSTITIARDIIFTSSSLQLGDYDFDSFKNSFIFLGSPFVNYADNKYFITNGLGKVKANVNGSGLANGILFPVGNATYSPVLVYNISSSIGKLNVSVEDVLYINGSSAPIASANSVNKTWQLSQAIPTANMDIGVTCHWTAGLELAGFNDGACWISHHDGSNWDQDTPSAAINSSGLKSISRLGISSLSPFSVVSSTVLPVEFISFEATQKTSTVQLNWVTALEQNNRGFSIEHSLNGRDFSPLDFISSRGISFSNNDYAYCHYSPVQGPNYYRLKQIDQDGQFSFSDIIMVNFKNPRGQSFFTLYPTFTNNFLVIETNPTQNHAHQYWLLNTDGALIKQLDLYDQNRTTIDVSQLPSGSYFIRQLETGHIERFFKL